jgi:glycosyltransferase involved in cell wall biosynthesis
MLGRAFIASGIDVTVLCLVPLHEKSDGNLEVRGSHFGISYEYTSGTTRRNDSFLLRRWYRAKGILKAFYRIISSKCQRRIDCLYIYDRSYGISYVDLACIVLARVLGIPVAREMNELPWALKSSRSPAERRISPLWGVDGIVAISDRIQEWAVAESRRLGKNKVVVHVPILADVNEVEPAEERDGEPYVLFAGSAEYVDIIVFILDAMETVWRHHPECRLYLTGFAKEDKRAGRVLSELGRRVTGRVRVCGYLARQDFVSILSKAKALLIPLPDDDVSRARFPTKIGEYLSASVPVVTSRVGEIPRYLYDGENAFVAEPGDPSAFGEKILECLDDPERAHAVGLRGRKTAESVFHYEAYTKTLGRFVGNIT